MSTDPERQTLLTRYRSDKSDGLSSTQVNPVSAAEGGSWVVMTSLLVLGIGVSLEVDRFVNDKSDHQNLPSPIFRLDKFVYTEGFDIGCMAVAVLWIVFTLARYYCYHEKETSKKLFIGNYLIYGLVFFALGGSFLEILQAMLFFSYNCASATGRAYVLSRIVYIIAQVVFIFSSRYRHIFNRTLCNGIFLFHIVVTNIILYLRTFLESKMDYHHNTTNHTHPKFTTTFYDNISCDTNFTHNDFALAYRKSRSFLAPFCLEFSLTATALLAELWLEHGHETANDEQSNHISTASNDDQPPAARQQEVLGSVTSASILGLFVLGSFIFVFIYLSYAGGYNGEWLLRIYRLILVLLLIVICLIGLSTLSWNSPLNGDVGLDEFLMYLSLLGNFAMNLLEIMGASGSLYTGQLKEKQERFYAYVSIMDNILWCVQSTLQAAFITKALHRAPRRIKLANTSSLAVILIFSNLAVWLMNTIDLEDTGDPDGAFNKAKFFQMPENMYGQDSWHVVKLVIYPLLVFFRIHCAFTFYRVFNCHRTLA